MISVRKQSVLICQHKVCYKKKTNTENWLVRVKLKDISKTLDCIPNFKAEKHSLLKLSF